MTPDAFWKITNDIESHLDKGEAYELEIHTVGNSEYVGSWKWLGPPGSDVIVVSEEDQPPVYLFIGYIECVSPR